MCKRPKAYVRPAFPGPDMVFKNAFFFLTVFLLDHAQQNQPLLFDPQLIGRFIAGRGTNDVNGFAFPGSFVAFAQVESKRFEEGFYLIAPGRRWFRTRC